MDEHAEYLGRWGLPGSELTWPGRFVYKPGSGVELEFIAPDEDLPYEGDGPVYTEMVSHYPIVHGRTLRDYVTLVDVRVSRISGPLGRGYEAVLRPRRAFVGYRYDPEEPVAFKRLHVGIDGLENWSNTRPGNYKYFFEPRRFELSYTPPPPIRLGGHNGIEMRVMLGPSMSSLPRRLHRFSFEQGAYLELTAATPHLYDELHNLAHSVRDFMSFVTGRGMHIRWQTGYLDPDPLPAKQFPHQVHVFEQGTAEPPDLGNRHTGWLEPDEMLFTADRTRSTPAKRFERWLAFNEDARDVVNLYLAERYYPGLPLEFKFLAMAQAAETYHGRRHNTKRLPSEQHSRNVDAIVQASPKRLQEFTRSRLTGQNRRAFRDCMLDLLNRLPAAVSDEILDPADFAMRVYKARNRYTHWNPDLEASAAKGGELYGLTSALRAVLDALLLRELGFSKKSVDQLLSTHADFRRELRRALRLVGS